MARARTIAGLDPELVPLPNGTEVTTRVDRHAGERRVPQGAVGRVTASVGEEVVVHVAGVGPVRYRRNELTVRSDAQLRFALGRAASWTALRPCVVLETVVGSRAWGLADEDSDTDRRGAFVPPLSWSAGLQPPPEQLTALDGSSTYWEIGKLVAQAVRADPNTLETLFVASASATDEMGQLVLDEREAFVSQAIYGSFARYALSQLDKLRKSLRLAEHHDVVLTWLRADPRASLDAIAERLRVAADVRAPTPQDGVLLAKEHIKQLYHSLHDRGLLPRADFAAFVSYASEGGVAPESARELRPKNAYNLLRLLDTAITWLRDGRPTFRFEGERRARLLAIKRGEVPLAEVLDEAEARTPALEQARRDTALPRRPDLARVDALVRRVRIEAARRHTAQLPGPWGRDAPPTEPPQWEDTP